MCSGLAKVLCRRRHDFTYPGDPGDRIGRFQRATCPISDPGTPDTEWIPTVASLGWPIITRDRRIQDNRAEINAVREHGAKMVNLTGADAGTVWNQLEVFMTRWREIEPLIDTAGPFIQRATRTGKLRLVDLA